MSIPSLSPEVLPPPQAARLGLFVAVTLTLLPAWLCSAEAPVAVFTQTHNDYQRTRLPDQSFKAETYAFGEGGTWGLDEPGAGGSGLNFMRVARAAALPLAQANYVPTPNPDETNLLIFVFWGRTLGSRDTTHSFLPSVQPGYLGASNGGSTFGSPLGGGPPVSVAGLHSAAAVGALLDVNAGKMKAMMEQADIINPICDRIDDSNARVLGYSMALFRARHSPQIFVSRDVREEVALNRYYVVLQAYDFRTAWKEKKRKLLWSARISIQEDENDFDQSIEHMLAAAARLLGQDSDGLQRRVVPKGSVTTGDLKVLEYLPSK